MRSQESQRPTWETHPRYVGGSVVEFSLTTWDTGFNSKLMPKKREKIHTQIVGVFSESLDKRPTSFPLHTLISLS